MEGERAKGFIQNRSRVYHLWNLGGNEASVANGYGKSPDSACSWGGKQIYESNEVGTLGGIIYVTQLMRRWGSTSEFAPAVDIDPEGG